MANYKLREQFKQQAEMDPDALNLYGELEAQRHLLYTAWERYEDPAARGGLTIDHLRDLVNDVVKTAEKMVNMRNSTALTMVEIGLVQKRIIDGIERFIPDPDTQRAFVEYVTSGILEAGTGEI